MSNRQFVILKLRELPLDKSDIQNLKNYRDQMAGILSNLGLKRKQEKFYDAVDTGFIDVAKVLYHLFQNQNIRDAFLKEYPRSEAVDIVKALNRKLKTSIEIDGAEELSIHGVVQDNNSNTSEAEFFKNLEEQELSEKLEWVKNKYILFIKHEFPTSKEYHTHITRKSSAELAGELQVYDTDDPKNIGRHLKDSTLFTEYCEKAHRSENLEGHNTQFVIKIRRFLTNIKVEAHKNKQEDQPMETHI